MLNGGVVYWKSAKQSTIVMSSIEVEYIVVAEASMEVVWMSKFIDGLGNVMPTNKEPIEMLEVQKQELPDMEDIIKQLKQGQTSYDDALIAMNRLWSRLGDDLILLGARAGAGQSALEALQRAYSSRDSVPSCPTEEIFLCRLLKSDSIKKDGSEESLAYIKELVALRHSSTLELMKLIEDMIQILVAKIESNGQSMNDNLSIECDLEDSMAKLEESRRKLGSLKMQKDKLPDVQPPVPFAVNGSVSPESTVDKTIGLRDLNASIEEAKKVTSYHLSQFQETQEDNSTLSK
ncbi:E3 ubiquitin protein ligase BRE1-like protein 2 isoform X1 [Tanacetum coccineum]|uniref:E3 ubiquitin protein ligase n=1 Tax=Tanacetum coccineum TaxID=301880 RepID=A0ABQ5GE27_9ASTR